MYINMEPFQRLRIRGSAFLVGVVLVVTSPLGCGDDSAPPDLAVPVPGSFQQISTEILQPTCASSSSCHTDVGYTAANKLDLCTAPKPGSTGTPLCASSAKLADAYDQLVGVAAVNPQAKGMGLVRVKPCDPDNSLLMIKLLLPASAIDPKVGFGGHMPSTGSDSLPKVQLDAIHDWIARGAHRDEPDGVSGSQCVLGVDMSSTD